METINERERKKKRRLGVDGFEPICLTRMQKLKHAFFFIFFAWDQMACPLLPFSFLKKISGDRFPAMVSDMSPTVAFFNHLWLFKNQGPFFRPWKHNFKVVFYIKNLQNHYKILNKSLINFKIPQRTLINFFQQDKSQNHHHPTPLTWWNPLT